MPSRFGPKPEPEGEFEPQPSKDLGIDPSKRYNVYCTMRTGANVVYRNVLIRRATPLFGPDDAYSRLGEFVELEQADGNPVFISRLPMRTRWAARLAEFCR